jgi:hypothetical protein
VGALLLVALNRRMEWSETLTTRAVAEGGDEPRIPW